MLFLMGEREDERNKYYKDGSICAVQAVGNDITDQYTLTLVHNTLTTGAWNIVRDF